MSFRVTYKGHGDVAVFENRQPGTEAKFINKSSLFIQLLGVTRRLELKLISEQKVENIFVAPPYCQTACVSSEAAYVMRAGLSVGEVEQPSPSNRLYAALL